MNTRNGALAALEYLKHTSGTFAVEATNIPSTQGGGFNFKVTLTEHEHNPNPNSNSIDEVPSSTKPALAEVSNS